MSMSYSEALLENLTDDSSLRINQQSNARLQVLLIDFMVAARAGKIARGECKNQRVNVGSELAINSSFLDLDDIDWTVMTHPGSIIWSALLDSLYLKPQFATRFPLAAMAGYRTSASAAKFFGTNHRKKWHVTTTAGALASATTSCVFQNLSKTQHLTALRSTSSNMGGIAIADRRTGAAIFNRAAATSLGLLAAHYSAGNLPSAIEIWEGERGILQLFSITEEAATMLDGVSTTSLRLFPYNGFVQSLVYAITNLSESNCGELVELQIGVNAITNDLVDGSIGGNYWDLKHSAASAWQIKDVTRSVEASPKVLAKIRVEVIDIPVSGAEVRVKTVSGTSSLRVEVAPGSKFGAPDHDLWQLAKWQRLIGEEIHLAREFSSELMGGQIDSKTIAALYKFLI